MIPGNDLEIAQGSGNLEPYQHQTLGRCSRAADAGFFRINVSVVSNRDVPRPSTYIRFSINPRTSPRERPSFRLISSSKWKVSLLIDPPQFQTASNQSWIYSGWSASCINIPQHLKIFKTETWAHAATQQAEVALTSS